MKAGCFADISASVNSVEFIFADRLLETIGQLFMYFHWNI